MSNDDSKVDLPPVRSWTEARGSQNIFTSLLSSLVTFARSWRETINEPGFSIRFSGFKNGIITSPHIFYETSFMRDCKRWLTTTFGLPEASVELFFCGYPLDDGRTFGSYGIQENSVLFLGVREGPSDEIQPLALHEKSGCKDLTGLWRAYELVPSEEDDMMGMAEEKETCYIMPCGHTIAPSSLAGFVEARISENKQGNIQCPFIDDGGKCNVTWAYPVILKVTGNELPETQRMRAEVRMSLAYVQLNCDAQQCSVCNTILMRDPEGGATYKANCRVCANDSTPLWKPSCASSQPNVEAVANASFCWGCSADWKDEYNEHAGCANEECYSHVRQGIVSILSESVEKRIGSVTGVPSVRACPKCGQLIHHVEACKHMQCAKCKTRFCFVCMKLYRDSGGWQCGSSGDVCPIHPRQGLDALPRCGRVELKDVLK